MKQKVAHAVARALAEVARARHFEGELPSARGIAVDRAKKPEHGDFATNVAMVVSKRLSMKPLDLANELCARLAPMGLFSRVEVAPPGFINLALAPAAFHEALLEVLESGQGYGRAPAASGERINLEFVSANPTGPMHIGHGRGAVTGDAIGRLLEAVGHRVVREYYVNDAGNQIKLLSDSVLAKVFGKPDPEGGYGANAYIADLANHAKSTLGPLLGRANEGDAQAHGELGKRLASLIVEGFPGFGGIRGTLRALDVMHDVWTSEAQLHGDGKVDRAIDTLDRGEWLGRDGDAITFLGHTKKLGDDKDRVVFKSDGGHTYFASDIAYHKDKLDRGFSRLIDVWGADHHGYIPRVRAALSALGLASDKFEVELTQMVALIKNGEPYRMGKRLGNFVTIDEILEDIDAATGRPGSGRDALRYFFTSRRADAQLTVDVDLASKQSLDNPVYYLQYGHARLSAILRKGLDECGLSVVENPGEPEQLGAVTHPDELALIALLASWPETLANAAKERAPHTVVGYLTQLAQAFQSYYTRLKKENDTILPRTPERADGSWKTRDGGAYAAKVHARLWWVRAIRDVYAQGLGLLGVSAPERMERKSEIDAAAGDAGSVDATADDGELET